MSTVRWTKGGPNKTPRKADKRDRKKREERYAARAVAYEAELEMNDHQEAHVIPDKFVPRIRKPNHVVAASAPIAKPQSELALSIETITPDDARKYLERNRNRKVRQRRVEWYASLMQAGRWHIGTDAIGFDRNGNLINGQHRLMAIEYAGVPVRMVVVRGLEPDVYKHLDSGDPRALKDHIGMTDDPEYAVEKAAIAKRFAYYIRRGKLDAGSVYGGGGNAAVGGSFASDVDDLLGLVNKYQGITDAVVFASNMSRAAKIMRVTKSQIGFAHCLFAPWHPDIEGFFRRAFGLDLPNGLGDPARLLGMRLSASASAPSNQRLDSPTVFGYIIIAANHDARGAELGRLQWPRSDAYPQPAVQVAAHMADLLDWDPPRTISE